MKQEIHDKRRRRKNYNENYSVPVLSLLYFTTRVSAANYFVSVSVTCIGHGKTWEGEEGDWEVGIERRRQERVRQESETWDSKRDLFGRRVCIESNQTLSQWMTRFGEEISSFKQTGSSPMFSPKKHPTHYFFSSALDMTGWEREWDIIPFHLTHNDRLHEQRTRWHSMCYNYILYHRIKKNMLDFERIMMRRWVFDWKGNWGEHTPCFSWIIVIMHDCCPSQRNISHRNISHRIRMRDRLFLIRTCWGTKQLHVKDPHEVQWHPDWLFPGFLGRLVFPDNLTRSFLFRCHLFCVRRTHLSHVFLRRTRETNHSEN